jgi:pyruvate/2-oxoglutarate dehydrogenase complex dihydrolipoamide dehydrogenase (E3) component
MNIAVVGGGPGGYEAALVAAGLGAEVTLIERAGMGGACVLWDCVPSKTLCSTAESVTSMESGPALGLTIDQPRLTADLPKIAQRILMLAKSQSADIERKVRAAGITIIDGTARFVDEHTLAIEGAPAAGSEEHGHVHADAILLATGSSPRELDTAKPDGRRILNARQVYDLDEVPPVLPGEDADAAAVLEGVFERRGMTIFKNARASEVRAVAGGVEVSLNDGRVLKGTHALMTVGQVPNTHQLTLEHAGVRCGDGGEIAVDGVSRTNVSHIYAAGDVTGGTMLASTAAMQGRIAMWHALGQAVSPLNRDEIAVDGFVKIVASRGSGTVRGGTIVAPHASDLILPLSLAVHGRLTVPDVAQAFSIYPSFGGSVQEAARLLMGR